MTKLKNIRSIFNNIISAHYLYFPQNTEAIIRILITLKLTSDSKPKFFLTVICKNNSPSVYQRFLISNVRTDAIILLYIDYLLTAATSEDEALHCFKYFVYKLILVNINF